MRPLRQDEHGRQADRDGAGDSPSGATPVYPRRWPRQRGAELRSLFAGERWWRQPVVQIAGVLIGANALGGVATFVFLQYLIPGRVNPRTLTHARHFIAVAFIVYLCVVIPVGAAINARIYLPVARWLRQRRAPSPPEQWATLLQPVRQAAGAFSFWLVAAVGFAALSAAEGYPPARVAVDAVGVLLGALASCSLSVLLIERVMRPTVTLALGGDLPVRPYGVGVRPRLLLAWAFGSGVPVVGLILTVVDHNAGGVPDLTLPVLFLCAVALSSGFALTYAAARSVSEPLEAVRSALARVEAGDLNVELDVNDGGEVGRLEAGVNRMVAGLRQRRALEDLFGRHVGRAVAQHVLERGRDLGGERQMASMLFVDLLGSTRMAATLPPEDVVRTLNQYFQAVVDIVGEEGGWVNQFQGDGAVCVFGPPRRDPQHALRALRAARRLRAEMEAAGPPDRRWGRLEAAIGVSCGEVVAGNIGSPDRFEYTVIGDPVNEAARLTEQAKGRSARLLASEAVVLAAGPEEAAHWRRAGEVVLRGRAAETVIYEAVE